MTAYYNEIDPYAAQWLRNLIDAGHIAPGYVDERSIEDVLPNDLNGFAQYHFFAGIGIWSFALRAAGWPDDKPVWTGSCPCQPFSAAGKGDGFVDERHLWPAWNHLIEQHKPTAIFGEQVASKDGLGWLDLVQTDLEGKDYSFGANDLCAAGVGAPHIRQRLWFYAERLAYTSSKGPQEQRRGREEPSMFGKAGGFSSMANTQCKQHKEQIYRPGQSNSKKSSGKTVESTGLCNTNGPVAGPEKLRIAQRSEEPGWKTRIELSGLVSNESASPTNGLWANVDWILCRDNKFRPVEPGTFPLANGITNRVGRLRAYGNAINAEVAKVFIESVMEYQKMEDIA